MSGAITEEDIIRRAQHLDFIYSQSGTLYDIILQAPCPSNDKSRIALGPHVDDVIGYVSTSIVNQVVRKLGQLAITDNLASTTSATTSNTFSQSTDVNLVQTSKTSKWKNHNQHKKNALIEQSEANVKEPNPSNNNKGKNKLKFMCLACKEDHLTKDYSCLADVQKFMEQSKNPTPVVLTNPFPTQHQQMVAQVPVQQPTNQSAVSPSRASSSSVNILMVDSQIGNSFYVLFMFFIFIFSKLLLIGFLAKHFSLGVSPTLLEHS